MPTKDATKPDGPLAPLPGASPLPVARATALQPSALQPSAADRLFRTMAVRAAVALVLLGGPGARAADPVPAHRSATAQAPAPSIAIP
jgi:hypothetical protein